MSARTAVARVASRSAIVPGTVVRLGPLSVRIRMRTVIVTTIIALAALALGIVAMTQGSMQIAAGDVLPRLLDPDSGRDGDVLRTIRLPRTLAALTAGAALGISGAVFQSVSRNALGSPDVIGLTTGAATGAIAQIVLFGGGPLQVALGALVGGIGTSAIIYVLSLRGGVTGGYRLVLIGLGVGALLGAVNGFLLVRGNIDRAVTANLWLSGSLDSRQWAHVIPVAIGLVVVVPLLWLLVRHATLLEMGDDIARELGVGAERTRVLLIGGAVVLAALATAAVGPIAFIALAAPQIATRLVRDRSLGLASAGAMGAFLLVGADVVTQFVPSDLTLPIGQMTGILGGLYLVWLLTRSKQL